MVNSQYLHHSNKITVTVNDSDFKGRAKPSAIMGYFQDIAVEHADIIGVGYDEMTAKNLSWILIRMSFKTIKSPRIGQELLIQTFPEKPNKFDVNRGYYIYDNSGETIVLGSSKWCVLNTESGRLQRIDPLFSRFDDTSFINIQPFDDANPKLKVPSESESGLESVFSSDVRLTDLDRYYHMNNARYGDIVLNAHSLEFLENNEVSRLDINFVSQLFLGDSYEVLKAQTDSISHIEAVKSDKDAVIFRTRVEFCEI